MRHIPIFLILLMFSSIAHASTFYKWVDEKGTVNITDDYDNIPSKHRGRVEIEWFQEESAAPPIQKIAPEKKEEAKADIYGLGEAYWRDRIRPWKEFLKAAEANYEKARQRFIQKAMDFSEMRFGSWSRTQYKMHIIELDKLKEEMVKYADQAAEAREGMEKISKEAKEARADPDWLN
jgi:hypothetical protein